MDRLKRSLQALLFEAAGALPKKSPPETVFRNYGIYLEDKEGAGKPAPVRVRPRKPMFSLITYADGTPWLIDRTVLSVMASRFESYELLIGEKECGDAGERYSSLPRVRVVTAEWSIAPLKAAESASSGDVIIRLEPGDVLRRGALSEFCAAFEGDPLLEAVYSDSDMLYDGRRDSPRMRAERGLLTLLCCEPLLRPLAVRRRLHFAAGGFLGGNNEGLASYAFRCLSMAAEVRHIDRALLSSSRRDIAEAKPFAVSRKVCVYEGKTEGLLRPVWERGRRPRVCVVTYAPDEQYRLKRLLECMEDIAAYPRLETVIAAGSGLDDRYEKYLAALEKNGAAKLVRVKENRPYVPRLLNAAARKTGAEFLIFLSPALIPVTPELVEELITPLLLPGLGICGGKVKNANGRLLHTGFVMGLNGGYGSFYFGEDDDCRDMLKTRLTNAQRNVSAVWGGFMAVYAKAFASAGGFDEVLEKGWDVEFCLRAERMGFGSAYTPFAEATVLEPTEVEFRCEKLDLNFGHDPYITRAYDLRFGIPQLKLKSD